MQLFQKSVLHKYLNQLNSDDVSTSYEKFKEFFFNPQIQENIRLDKEEQFQEGFLRELFVNVFSYIINPHPDYNLTTEYKNETGSKKADGAILINSEAIGVIELKSTKTKDLESIRKQAFDYKANHKSCVYVVTSNFEKLRFYINNAVEYEEFDLFNITKDRFSLLYLCLNHEQLLNDLPLKIKEESLVQEEAVTKKLYSDYSEFKRELFQDIVVNNLNNLDLEQELEIEQKKLLFKKTQKLIDRILFILFCEDRGLLPPNEISKIISEWEKLKDLDAYTPLYERFRKHFGYINTGYKKDGYEIFAYNGGLFEEDEVLKDLKIGDEVLQVHTKKLTSYDFESEVDVDILGHIFEQSITEIETITAEIEGVAFDKNKSRRKKEGVYYTPKYITKYIVDNTVGKLCEEKKNELGIVEEEYFKGKKHRKKDTILELEQRLNDYQKYLLTLRICDPACGSGAFLNQALEFLITEHRYIAELKAKLFEQPLVLFDVENDILEKNLYGVDINEEAVEIAKLSLWLRTAKKGRKLTSLNENIKCGNSLIDDPEVAGDKAFKWEEEFPEVFAKGGFDVVISNPPYVGIQSIEWDDRRYFETIYNNATGRFDLYTLFIEKALCLKKPLGAFSFIVPGKILNNRQFKDARKMICIGNNVKILKIDDKVFDEVHVNSVILLNQGVQSFEPEYSSYQLSLNNVVHISTTLVSDILADPLNIFRLEINQSVDALLKKIKSDTLAVKEIAEVKDGIVAGVIKDLLFVDKKINDDYHRLYFGKHLSRYYLRETDVWVNYQPEVMMNEEISRKNGKRPGLWMRDEKIFLRNKILTRFVGKEIIGCYDDKSKYYEHTLHSTHITDSSVKDKYLLSLYNSRLLNFYYQKTNSKGGDIFPQVRISSIENLPIKIANEVEQNKLIKKVEQVEIYTVQYKSITNNYLKLILSKFTIENPGKKLEDWHKLEFSDFLKELKKSKIKLSLSEEAEWMEYFNEQKAKALELKAEIDKTDKEIDQMVYELYGLTDEEIKIVEDSVKN